jgi:soluble lytic murein transglycosylase
MFDGELIYVFASYNSGENAIKDFLEKNNPKDLAEFIEFYPYDETRDYTKKVLRNYIIYKALGE